jgi:hypothetical protein
VVSICTIRFNIEKMENVSIFSHSVFICSSRFVQNAQLGPSNSRTLRNLWGKNWICVCVCVCGRANARMCVCDWTWEMLQTRVLPHNISYISRHIADARIQLHWHLSTRTALWNSSVFPRSATVLAHPLFAAICPFETLAASSLPLLSARIPVPVPHTCLFKLLCNVTY